MGKKIKKILVQENNFLKLFKSVYLHTSYKRGDFY